MLWFSPRSLSSVPSVVSVRSATALLAALVLVSCVDHLPDQDLRILSAQPQAKLSASDLWKDFETDGAAAKTKYFGKAIDVSDRPTAIETDTAKRPSMFFAQAEERGVRAFLLDERAAEILKEAKVGQRLTLRCFCEGTDDKKDVVLRSCIRP